MTYRHAALAATLLPLFAAAAHGQAGAKSVDLAREVIAEAFPESRGPNAHVLLLGVFHFKDSGLDDFKPQHNIDVLAPERQREIEAISAALVAFEPTKVAVERKPDAADELDARYQEYVRGEWELPANEIYQLGFRVAHAAGHAGVYPVDAPGRWFEPQFDAADFAKEHEQTDLLRDPYGLSYNRLSRRLDELKIEHPLRDHLLLLNEPALLERAHGIYLPRKLGVREGEDYPGADGFVSQWYNRNLRIFGNIQRLIDTEDERILVIIGAGHVPVLRHLVQSAPNTTLVEVADVL